MWNNSLRASALRILLAVGVVLSLPLLAVLVTDDFAWSIGDFVLVGALVALIGAAIEMIVRRAGTRAVAAGLAILGAVAGVLGELDDAPGLVLIGLVLILCAGAMWLRSPHRRPALTED